VSLAIRNLQVDVPADDFEVTVAFWAGALGATPRHADGPFVHLDGVRSAIGVHLQRLDAGEAGYHLDLEADDVDAEVARLEGLGAKVLARPPSWAVLVGPAGLRFCVVAGDAPPDHLAAQQPDRAYLDAVFIDVPPDDAEVATRFWSDALGARVETAAGEGHTYTGLADVQGPAGDLDVEVQRIGAAPRFHVDVSADDVLAEAVRLEELGARRVAAIETWVTLADPAGNLLCVVPHQEEAT
jgi:predicted enzyme related to lactoylglutathione lyase